MELEYHQLDRRWERLRARRPQLQRRLLASLAESGQQTPIVVVAVASQADKASQADQAIHVDQANRYLVIDGYKRIAALEQLGRDTVEAVIWPMTEAEALVLDRSMRLSERETALEEGWLLAELEQQFGYGLEELARRFDRSISWVSRRLRLVELIPESVQQQVRDGKISAHVATKFLAPVAGVSLDDCLRMAEAIARHRFNTRQTGQLYAAWRDGTRVSRQRILEQPELFLKARQQVEPQKPTPADELLRDLEMVVAIAGRASRRLRAAAPEMDFRQNERVRRQIDCALDKLNQLARRIPTQEQLKEEKPKEEEHVEQGSADGDSGVGRSEGEPPRNRPRYEDLPPDGAQSRWLELFRGAAAKPARESRALPSGDLGAFEQMQGESGPGP